MTGVGEGRGGVRVMLGQDKLARISELLYHEEAAHEAAHTLGGHDTLGPPPDFVLQEADTVLKTHDDLRNFWRKYHHVQLERLALRSEGEVLRQEGRHLRGLLKKYFVSLGVTDAALSQSAAPVTVSHLNLSHNQQDPRHPSRRRSHSVPVGGVGCIPTVHGDSKGASKMREVVAVQEAHLLVRSAALHSLPRLRTC
ncbi:uncharacterized protein LOC121857168 [Homarus americanus]|uniref:Dynein regulatory complex subunit 2-like 1 n=1 Tax=Homarus americanus TaxID=6706 RepID=A0A8J5TNA3_HOMAM|nr:uncharacterized protein LOC121857168 [Homarus americanus]KAG7175788.1 Dynein regulatory complex subunit 2-like 1 [Homarus americanus]